MSERPLDLGAIAPLLLPHPDSTAPVPTDGLLRLSAALSSLSYSMDVEPWLEAGWQDATVQYEGDLTVSAEPEPESPSILQKLGQWTSRLKLRLLQRRLEPQAPLLRLPQTLRELRKTHSGKAVVMAHPAPDGRYVIAIGFTGTGRQLYDWVPNLRMGLKEGMHRGFLELTEQFEANADSIVFPQTARQLGLARLSLSDILRECATPGSRFTLWLSGHSQGASVMQIWTLRRIRDDGVLPRCITGCGFASPCPISPMLVRDPAAFPLLHVVHDTDAIPHAGCGVQLGRVLRYDTTDRLHRACYQPAADETALKSRRMAADLVACMRSAPETAVGFLDTLVLVADLPPEQLAPLLGRASFLIRFSPSVSEHLSTLLHGIIRRGKRDYESFTQAAYPAARADLRLRLMRDYADRIGLRALVDGLMAQIVDAHAIRPDGAYSFIVAEGVNALHPQHWTGGRRPGLISEDGKPFLMVVKPIRRQRERVGRLPHRHVRR